MSCSTSLKTPPIPYQEQSIPQKEKEVLESERWDSIPCSNVMVSHGSLKLHEKLIEQCLLTLNQKQY